MRPTNLRESELHSPLYQKWKQIIKNQKKSSLSTMSQFTIGYRQVLVIPNSPNQGCASKNSSAGDWLLELYLLSQAIQSSDSEDFRVSLMTGHLHVSGY